MTKLTDSKIRKLTKPGLYAADTTLYLRIAPGGSKSWIQRVTFEGRRIDRGLGSWPVMRTDDAKLVALENRRKIGAGIDPWTERRKAKIPMFRRAAELTLEANKGRWKTGKSAKDWHSVMTLYAFPIIGNRRVDLIGREDVLSILTPIWTEKSQTARRLRQRMRTVFSWCQAHGYVESNPAGESINGALPKMPSIKENFKALHYNGVAEALEKVRAAEIGLSAKYCLEFLVLTATRSGEARGAVWSEVDMENRTWKIPAIRMKGGKEHRIPLSDAAVDVLERAKMLRDGSDLIFPAPKKTGAPMGIVSLNRVLKATGYSDQATIHGFRSSFRDWCAETSKPREIAELALAHTIPGVEGAYFRSDLFDRRRLLMDQWAAYVTGTTADVIELRQA